MIKKNKFNCVFLSLNIVIVSKNLKSLQTMCLYRTKKKSTNILGVSVLGAGPVGTQSASRPVETRRNPFRLTRLNPSKHVQTCYVSSRPNELFSIFIFLYFLFYTSSPLLLLLPHPPPPQFPPFIPKFFLFGGGGGGGEGNGNGQGTATAPGGSHHHHRRPVGRPSEGGGTKSPPPSPSNKTKKKNLQVKRHIYSRQ